MAIENLVGNLKNSTKNSSGIAGQIVNNDDHQEGGVTKSVESQTAKLPSITFLGLALGSMIASAGFMIFGNEKKGKEIANFIGHWAPCFLLLGIYNKLVKQQGSDHTDYR
jgi:hypothetical protein